MEVSEVIIEAVKAGDLTQIEQLLDQHPALLQYELDGELSPALPAMYYGEPKVARLLVQCGVPLHIFTASGSGQSAC